MKAFFDVLRARFRSLSQSQVDGINALLHATTGLPVRHRAYILATSWHETAGTMRPITEFGARPYFDKYEPGTAKGKALGNTLMGDGYRFRGRGYVQITGRANYQKASLATGRDLVADPDKALEPEIAAWIIVKGMLQGWFTGKKLSDYSNYLDMRRVVNGTDKALVIAEYARWFEQALNAIGNVTEAVQPSRPFELPQLDFSPVEAPESRAGAVAAAILAIAAAVAGLGTAVAAYLGVKP